MKPWIQRTLAAVFSVAALSGLAACSHHGGMGMSSYNEADAAKFRGRMIERVSQELALDDAQKQRLQVLADKLQEQRQSLMPAGSNPRADMQALVAGTTFDRQRAQALVESKTEAVRSKSPEVIAAAGDFYDSLRPDQQQKVRDFMNSRHGRWHRG